MQQQTRAVSSVQDNGGITIKKSGGDNEEASDQDTKGNQAVIEAMKGEPCPCGKGGILTGATTTEESEAVDTERRWAQDLEFDTTWSDWIDYPKDKLKEENEKVEAFNQRFDRLNSWVENDIEDRYEDEAADGNLSGMWGPATDGNAFSGFQGDLNKVSDSHEAQGATWTPNAFDIEQEFQNAFTSPQAQVLGASQLPVKGYANFRDEGGKITSHVTYGWGEQQPRWLELSKEVFQSTHWCEVREGDAGVREMKNRTGRGGSFGSKRNNRTRGGGFGKSEVVGYRECATFTMRMSGGEPRELVGEKHAEKILADKTKEAEAWRDFHQSRLDYIDMMEKL